MPNVLDNRPARPSRAAVPPMGPFETLDHAHRAALSMLKSFDSLLVHLDNHGDEETARASAQEVIDFFNGPGRHHHQEEEQHVFPALLNSGDGTLVQHVKRLQQDHGWIEEDWRLLLPQLQAIAHGYNAYDLEMLRAALPIFTALYEEHIALEENLVYPAAKRHLQALRDGGAARTTPG